DSDSDSDSDTNKRTGLPNTTSNNSSGTSATKKSLPSTGTEDEQILYSVAGLGLVSMGIAFYGTSKKRKKGDNRI
ncbi:LPXTG cell wall anchor domain-containing protein, partial [Enterococcus pallens]